EDLGALIRHAGTASRVVGTPARAASGLLRALDWFRLSPLAPYHYTVYSEPFYFDDICRGERELGWRPRYGNVAALTRSYDWFLAHRGQPSSGRARSSHQSGVGQGVLALLKRLS